MSEQEIVTAPVVVAEPEAPATPPGEEPKAEAPQEKKPDPDWQKAYIGLQTNLNRAHQRTEDVLRQNSALAEAVKEIKETQTLLARQTLGEDEVKALESKQAQAQERAAALQAAQSAGQFISAQTSLFLDLLKGAGIEPTDPEIDWGRDARDVQEWRARVGPSVSAKLAKVIAAHITKAEEGLKAKSKKEIEEEAKVLADRISKESGIDKVDTSRGAGPASIAQRIAGMDPTSPEFHKILEDAKRGRLK